MSNPSSSILASLFPLSLLLLLILLVTLLIALFFLRNYLRYRQWVGQFGAPPSSFRNGHNDLILSARKNKRYLEYRIGLLAYGEVHQIIQPLGLARDIVIADPDWAEYILCKLNCPRCLEPYRTFQLFSGNSMFTILDQAEWKKVRRRISHAFAPKTVRLQLPILRKFTDVLLARLDGFVESGKVVDLDENFVNLTLDFVGESAFGVAFGATQKGGVATITQLFHFVLVEVMKCVNIPWRQYGWKKDTITMRTKVKEIRSIAEKIVQTARAEILTGGATSSTTTSSTSRSGNTKSIFSELVSVEGLSDSDIVDNVITFLFAGHDTTAHGIAFCIYDLLTHPNVLKRVREEVESVCGPDDPSSAQLDQLHFLHQCIQESLRLHPPGQGSMRCLPHTHTINGVTIQQGENVFVSATAMHYNPRIWPNPTLYDPERFTADKVRERPRCAWMPFSQGPRDCVGKMLAIMEMKYVLSRLFQRYTFALPPSFVFRVDVQFTNKSADGVPVKVSFRE